MKTLFLVPLMAVLVLTGEAAKAQTGKKKKTKSSSSMKASSTSLPGNRPQHAATTASAQHFRPNNYYQFSGPSAYAYDPALKTVAWIDYSSKAKGEIMRADVDDLAGVQTSTRLTPDPPVQRADFVFISPASGGKIVYGLDEKGTNVKYKIYVTDLKGQTVQEYEVFLVGNDWEVIGIGLDPSSNDHILVKKRKRMGNFYDVYRVSLTDGKADEVANHSQLPTNKQSVPDVNWIIDPNGKVQQAVSDEGGVITFYRRDPASGNFIPFHSTSY